MTKTAIDKKKFYEYLSLTDRYQAFFFTIPLENPRFELHFDWSSQTPSGKFNPMMSAQLIDTKKQGFRKYVTKDLHWDCVKENTTTQYRVWKKLNDWATNALENYNLESEEI